MICFIPLDQPSLCGSSESGRLAAGGQASLRLWCRFYAGRRDCLDLETDGKHQRDPGRFKCICSLYPVVSCGFADSLHWPYVAFAYAANSDESRDVLLYDDSSRIVPSWLITHVTHFLFPMSIPILSSIFFTSLFLCVASWKLHPSIRAQSPSNTAARIAPFTSRSLRSCMTRGQPATCSGWIGLSCIHQPAHAPRGDHQVHEVQKTEPGR